MEGNGKYFGKWLGRGIMGSLDEWAIGLLSRGLQFIKKLDFYIINWIITNIFYQL